MARQVLAAQTRHLFFDSAYLAVVRYPAESHLTSN